MWVCYCIALVAAVVWLWLPGITLDSLPATDFGIYHRQLKAISGDQTTLDTRWFYPPFAAVLLWPFKWFDLAQAKHLWLVVEALVLAALTRECGLVLGGLPRGARVCAAVGLVLACSSVIDCLRWGQLGILVVVFAIVAFRRSAPAWLAAAIATKVYPAAYALVYLARRQLRVLFRLAVWVVAIGAVVPWLWLGTHTWLLMLGRALELMQRARGPLYDDNQTLGAWLTRLFVTRSLFDEAPSPMLFHVPSVVVASASVIVSFVVVGYTVMRTRSRPASDPIVFSSVMLACSLVIDPAWRTTM